MTASQAIASALNGSSSVTAICSGRIYAGMRPTGTTVPCINYFEVGGGKRAFGIERVSYSINCRATTAATAIGLARAVSDLFGGTSGTGIYGDVSGFSVIRASVVQTQGLVPEVQDLLYNAPVDILLVYPTGAVS